MNILEESAVSIFRVEEWRQQVPPKQKLSTRLHSFCGVIVTTDNVKNCSFYSDILSVIQTGPELQRVLYRVGGTRWVYRLHHSIVLTLLLPTP
jgi:hypothetical protein